MQRWLDTSVGTSVVVGAGAFGSGLLVAVFVLWPAVAESIAEVLLVLVVFLVLALVRRHRATARA